MSCLVSAPVFAGDGGAPPNAKPACRRTGCGQELCEDKDVMTPCRHEKSFECYANARCERQASGVCGYTLTPAVKKCLADAERESKKNPLNDVQ